MITKVKLKELCDKYGVKYEKLIAASENVLVYGRYNEINNDNGVEQEKALIEVKKDRWFEKIVKFFKGIFKK